MAYVLSTLIASQPSSRCQTEETQTTPTDRETDRNDLTNKLWILSQPASAMMTVTTVTGRVVVYFRGQYSLSAATHTVDTKSTRRDIIIEQIRDKIHSSNVTLGFMNQGANLRFWEGSTQYCTHPSVKNPTLATYSDTGFSDQ